MPFVDGMNFRRQQLEDPKLANIPVVVVTGHPRKEKEARRLGISVYLKKPIPPSRLVEVVEQNCAHASRARSASAG
jgi:CheY-like chemotaxis protein